MRVIKTALREVYGLFVEDGSYALAVIFWLLCAVFVLPFLPNPGWHAPLLFAGLVSILLENVVRSAKH
jgi:hypothetical protein